MLFWENLSYKLASSADRIRKENDIELNQNIEDQLFSESNVRETEINCEAYDVFIYYVDEDQDYSENKLKKKLKKIDNYKIISIDQIHSGGQLFPGIEKCVVETHYFCCFS